MRGSRGAEGVELAASLAWAGRADYGSEAFSGPEGRER